ncbi:hypothetical protein DTL42_06230 [Bremerella cremea]|uniref:Uncharacterized protein n=1 Tax=Bremerella cremea TaxID=1031537 RepID=A0A368KWB8_9BACT|nr:hypothetical protein [Bremerella cremea]RCS54720.1 hypothetical protein DTL42_06230 [Bremerella cremea]
MSLYEYWCEQYDPQPVGSVDVNTEHIAQTNPTVVLFKLLAALLITAGMFMLSYYFLPLQGWQSVAVSSGIVLLYIGLAFFFVPSPNVDNLGWMGGMLDDPFHYSDDWNRSLLFWRGTLGPGRFVAGTILDVAVLLGIAKSDPTPCSYEYFEQQYQEAGQASIDNATVSELSSREAAGSEAHHSCEEEYQDKYGLSSTRFLINDDE